MPTTGQNALSIRKRDLRTQKDIGIGFRKLVFAHEATASDTEFDLTSLTVPASMLAAGFVAPSTLELTRAELLINRRNLLLVSDVRGTLQDFVSYTVQTNSKIKFEGFTAAAGEIFIGVIEVPVTGFRVTDAEPLVTTGTLLAGTTEFNVGKPFLINEHSAQQVGAITVYLDGVQQFRNVNNAPAAPAADGDYAEVVTGTDVTTTIEFNNSDPGDREVAVISTGLVVNNPSSSHKAALESLAGQVDAMIPVLATEAGVPESTFQAAPNDIDLRTFGERNRRMEKFRYLVAADTALSPVDLIQADTTGGAFTITLPASPETGDRVKIMDSRKTFGTSSLTVGRNGNNIEGVAADTVISTNGEWNEFVWTGISAYGWSIAK